jgi:6,7-dimethyl-8-ribityllumazine synthase
MSEIQGKLLSAGHRFAIVASRFNNEIVDRLIQGAHDALARTGSRADETPVVRVPGAFEIPLAVKRVALSRRFDAIIAIGCVIRGETPHFEYISSQVSNGIGHVALEVGIPVTFGVLTVDTEDQAMARSGPDSDNKGFEAAMAAIEMVNLLKQI